MKSDPEYERTEAIAELSRHHRDFARISGLVHSALALSSSDMSTEDLATEYETVLLRIRAIVG